MIDTIDLNILMSVWGIMTFVQGHKGVRKQTLLCHCLTKFVINLDGIWWCWHVGLVNLILVLSCLLSIQEYEHFLSNFLKKQNKTIQKNNHHHHQTNK